MDGIADAAGKPSDGRRQPRRSAMAALVPQEIADKVRHLKAVSFSVIASEANPACRAKKVDCRLLAMTTIWFEPYLKE
jgi:signal recognition particle subunit SEC65